MICPLHMYDPSILFWRLAEHFWFRQIWRIVIYQIWNRTLLTVRKFERAPLSVIFFRITVVNPHISTFVLTLHIFNINWNWLRRVEIVWPIVGLFGWTFPCDNLGILITWTTVLIISIIYIAFVKDNFCRQRSIWLHINAFRVCLQILRVAICFILNFIILLDSLGRSAKFRL